MTKTNLVICLDDPKIKSTLAEFLLQVQGGLTMGSQRTGLQSPKGSLLLATNDEVVERYKFDKQCVCCILS